MGRACARTFEHVRDGQPAEHLAHHHLEHSDEVLGADVHVLHVTGLVVVLSLLDVAEHRVRLADLLEPLLRGGVALVLVGVPSQRELAVFALDVRGRRRGFLQAEDGVEVHPGRRLVLLHDAGAVKKWSQPPGTSAFCQIFKFLHTSSRATQPRGPREDRKATMDVSPEALSELKQASPDAHVPVRAPQTPRAPPALFKSR